MTLIVSCRDSSGYSGAILIQWASGARNTPSRTTPSSDGAFSNGWTHPEGQQSIEALDLVFGALEHAGVDAKGSAKIVWADGKRLSIEHSTDRIHRGHPGVPRHLIETHVQGWLENCAPESYSERANLRNSTGSSDPGSTTMRRTSRAAKE